MAVKTMTGEKTDLPLNDLMKAFYMNHDRLVQARTTDAGELDNIAAGTTKEAALPWFRGKRVVAGMLLRVQLLRTAGTANKFDIEIRAKEGGTGMDVLFGKYAVVATELDELLDPPIPYISEEIGKKRFSLYVAIKAYTNDGSYAVRITALPRR